MPPESLPPLDRFRLYLANILAANLLAPTANPQSEITNQKLASISSQVDDSPGWTSLTSRPHDYDPSRVIDLYQDALTAWRKNPLAWRIIAITTDYVVGDHIRISSPNRSLDKFISAFWHHPKNRMDLRLEAMSDELARAGDLFVLLFHKLFTVSILILQL